MGIVNVTPDSFSGDGVEDGNAGHRSRDRTVERGADLLDIGGESTRPGHQPVDASIEIARVVPAIRAVRSQVARRADLGRYVQAGRLARRACRGRRPRQFDLGSSRRAFGSRRRAADSDRRDAQSDEHAVRRRVVDECTALSRTTARLERSQRGIARDAIILDPGIGFGKTADQNIAVLQALDRVVALGFPTMIGTSRKSTIGKLTGRGVTDRVYGTVATTRSAVKAGIDIVRVHDVAAARDAVAVTDAIVRDWRPAEWTQ